MVGLGIRAGVEHPGVIESYTVIKPITALGWFIIGTLYGDTDRKTALRADMHETLQYRQLGRSERRCQQRSGHIYGY